MTGQQDILTFYYEEVIDLWKKISSSYNWTEADAVFFYFDGVLFYSEELEETETYGVIIFQKRTGIVCYIWEQGNTMEELLRKEEQEPI